MSNDLMKLILPSYTVEWFPKGEHCKTADDGDLMLVDHGTWEDEVIEVAQHALEITEPELKGFTWCAHTAIIRGEHDGRIMVSEMGPRGYERRPLFDYQSHLYAIVHFDATYEQRVTACRYDIACESLQYGWLQYPPLVLDGLTGEKWACSWGDSIICSTHATMVLMGLGLFPDRPPTMVVPARMAMWVDAKSSPSIVGEHLILTPETPQPNPVKE